MRLALSAAIVAATATSALAQQHVDGYFRKNGTYVQPHYRSNPDSSRSNNYSSQGNINPYTGQRGTADPYRPSPPINAFGTGRRY